MPTLESIIYQNIETRKLRSQLKNELENKKHTYLELEILWYINEKKETSPSLIAKHLHHERAAISRGLKLLNDKSLLKYTYSEQDRRTVFVNLSSKGKTVVKSFEKLVNKA